MNDAGTLMTYTTFVDVLESNRGVDRAVTYVDGENSERRVPYGDIHRRALGILYHLQALGAQRGDKMIIFLSNNEQFLDGFWAALCGGIVPVPLAVGISDEHRHKLLRVARKLGRPLLYTDSKSLERLGALAAELGESALFAELKARAFLVESITDISRPGKLYRPAPEDLAFIQFSSGSTSEPKGVMLTHGNLIANAQGATAVGKYNDQDVTLSWMPLTHDMGLIGFYLIQFANRVHINLMPTELFVRRPLLWLQVAARKRVTLTCSPNFGYRHFLKVLGDRRLEGVDLSSIRQIYNGAEPISVELCNEFMSALAYTGLKHQAMYPVYGLAEASLAVAFPEPGLDYRWIRVNRHKLGVGAQVEVNPADSRDALELVCVGRVVPNTELRIADDERGALPDGRVGHILIRGPNVTRGYFGDPEATAQAIGADGWVDTGDLGFMHEGSLYIAGRSKEIIFVNGQNYYPYDLENIAQRAPGLDLNKLVAAGVAREGSKGEELVVFVLHRGSMQEFLPTAAAVSRLINEHTGLEVAQVIPTKRIPKTTSGKVQRHLLETAYVDGEFDAELAELKTLREAHGGAAHVSGNELETRLQSICEAALPGKRIDVNDNLFEIGASSLKLIEIHENVDREFPGLIDLTELFDHPTIAELAKHLEGKLKAAVPQT
ncbi:MAG TPA: non-ribosomal peptide synthetase [Steroidobacteraceae bacterium]|jgi:acyl-CoA synthetase (AMP-forming)/AMP-acid ligase II/aryl carrier-like protein|nr:non-ribosomal peptide synthetase [Steroidobacteraceae bacterium]